MARNRRPKKQTPRKSKQAKKEPVQEPVKELMNILYELNSEEHGVC